MVFYSVSHAEAFTGLENICTYEDEDKMVYQITPRTIDKINTRLKNRAMRDWIEAKEGRGDLASSGRVRDENSGTRGTHECEEKRN